MKHNSISITFAKFAMVIFMSLAGIFSTNVAMAHDSSPEMQKGAYFIDLLYLQDGKTQADAKVYFDKIIDVVAGHGLERVTPAFVITTKMNGDIEPQLVNVWSVSDPKNTFANIFSDDAYLQHVPLRNSIFDMGKSHMFMLSPTK